jgi:hypothetical protein
MKIISFWFLLIFQVLDKNKGIEGNEKLLNQRLVKIDKKRNRNRYSFGGGNTSKKSFYSFRKNIQNIQ